MTDTLGATASFLEFKGDGLSTFERALDLVERLLTVVEAFSRPPPQSESSRVQPPAREATNVTAVARSRPQPFIGNDATLNLFLRLGIDLRRMNVAKRRHGFRLRFEAELIIS